MKKLTLGGLQNNLEFELRLQHYIELRRGGQLLEARQHAQKYIAPHKDTHLDKIHRAAGLLAFPPDTQAEPYKVLMSSQYKLNPPCSSSSDHVFTIPMEFSRQPLRAHPSRAILPPSTSASSHRSLCRPFGAQDSILPLQVCKQQLQRELFHDLSLPYLLH